MVRDDEMHAFCPKCLTVYPMDRSRTVIHCCGRRHKIRLGTYRQGRYRCGGCGAASTLEDLQVARAPRVLVAVEETHPGAHRRIRTATAFDRDQATSLSPGKTGTGVEGHDFDVALEIERRDRRPVSAGFTTTRTLFTPRQWALFTSAFTKVRDAGHDLALERELTLMLTGALSSNNVLCGYARDWGRLAPLFSVRGFSVPVLSVELNPFHPTAGRGTLRSARARMAERSDAGVRRARLVPDSGANGQIRTQQHLLDLPVQPAAVDVVCRAADDTAGHQSPTATVCVTDPPYFDYIAYSELSEFFRVWLRDPSLGGVPLLPTAGRAVESFATGLEPHSRPRWAGSTNTPPWCSPTTPHTVTRGRPSVTRSTSPTSLWWRCGRYLPTPTWDITPQQGTANGTSSWSLAAEPRSPRPRTPWSPKDRGRAGPRTTARRRGSPRSRPLT